MNHKRKLNPEQVAKLQVWWKYKRVTALAMKSRLGVGMQTLLDAARGEGAYRS